MTEIIRMPTNAGEYHLIEANTTDDMIVSMWIDRKDSANTREQYRRVSDGFRQAIGAPLQAVNYSMLARWVKNLEGSDNTKKMKIGAIKSLFSFMLKTGYIHANPAVMIDSFKVADKKHTRVATRAEVDDMIAAVDNPRDKALIRVLYSAGCRVSELCALTWADVVPVKDGKAVLHIYGKGNKDRQSGISARTYRALLAIRDGAKDTDPVFRSNRKTRITRSAINQMLRRAALAANIEHEHISPHWFRHAHVSHALAKGGNPEAIRKQVGHASLATTTGYAHADESSADYLDF
ncbi:MAG: tyrosine-type recombinase/integrase [Aureliella sp.]